MRTLRTLLTAVVMALGTPSPSALAAGPEPPPPAPKTVAFVHASVIPMDRERILSDQTVLVANGEIVAVGPAAAVKVPAGALRVDATGRYLLPALCDMHVHLWAHDAWKAMLSPEARAASQHLPLEDFLFPYLANGVTLVQSLAATPDEIVLRERIARGELLGPRMILARMIDGPKKAWPPPLSTWVDSAAEAREAVRQVKAAGYDKIKVYSFLSRESYDAIVATARELRMDVVGHVPLAVSTAYTAEAGQKLIAHSEELAKHVDGRYDAEHVARDAGLLARRGVWLTPTLVTTRTFLGFFAAPEAHLARPEAVYFRHPMQLGVWSFMATQLYAPIPPEARRDLGEAFVKYQVPLTKAFVDQGGKLMTGSDAMMLGVLPGFALHEELKELVAAGLSPYQALRASTTNPYEYLGESDKAGTIGVGRRSDLLLVEANPLVDIGAAARVAGVLVRGRWLDADEIRGRMRRIASSRAAH